MTAAFDTLFADTDVANVAKKLWSMADLTNMRGEVLIYINNIDASCNSCKAGVCKMCIVTHITNAIDIAKLRGCDEVFDDIFGEVIWRRE